MSAFPFHRKFLYHQEANTINSSIPVKWVWPNTNSFWFSPKNQLIIIIMHNMVHIVHVPQSCRVNKWFGLSYLAFLYVPFPLHKRFIPALFNAVSKHSLNTLGVISYTTVSVHSRANPDDCMLCTCLYSWIAWHQS